MEGGGGGEPAASLQRLLANLWGPGCTGGELWVPSRAGHPLRKAGRKPFSEPSVDSVRAGSPTGLHKCQAGWEGNKGHQLGKAVGREET